jgi:hypothetical protein
MNWVVYTLDDIPMERHNSEVLAIFGQQKVLARVDDAVPRSIRRDTTGYNTVLHLQVQLQRRVNLEQ